MYYLFTRVSQNAKIGPMPAVMASKHTCPLTCGMRNAGCYAEHGNTAIHWRRLTEGVTKARLDFEQLCHTIRALPKRIRWRYGTAGDLPPTHEQVLELADANQGREAIVYTHGRQYETYREAGRRGLHINLSADSPAAVDELPADISAVCVLPADHGRHPSYTPAGRKIAPCPAAFNDCIDCTLCGACSKPRPNGEVIGFPAHGTRKRLVTERIKNE